jgi:hypothetical protein
MMAHRATDGVALLRRRSGGVSWFACIVTVRACCVLVSGGRLAISPFSWRGWCRCGEYGARGIAVGVRMPSGFQLPSLSRCMHAVACDAGHCSGGSSDKRSHRGERSLPVRPVRCCLACVVACDVADVLLLSQKPPQAAAITAPATTAPGTTAAAVSACCRCCR